jgi:hypothetical protein
MRAVSADYPSQQCCMKWRKERLQYKKERYIRRDTCIEKEWRAMMHHSLVMIWIRALIVVKIANK